MAFISIYKSLIICILSFYTHQIIANDIIHQSKLQTYIVHVDMPVEESSIDSENIENWYNSFLQSTITTSSNDQKSRLIYSYRNVFKGFAARLSADEVKTMEKMDGFISARPEKVYHLHTTHSPDFLGLHQNMGFWKDSNYGKGVIIGVLDTGVLPDHPSFSDEGMPPPPGKWKGKCETTVCNNKLIGARSFVNGTPLDEDGHGTHTSSTAAGRFVNGANVFGNANGTAVGVAPLAHLAVYKVCSDGCSEIDILAAMDAAIGDGVDVLSISLGGESEEFYTDGIAIGAYAAMEKGIFVSCSAGNNGPFYGSLANGAPWILTVGASTLDRKITSTAVLGNKEEFNGESLFQPGDFSSSTQLPLVFPGKDINSSDASFCLPSSLDNVNVKGKIVLCRAGGSLSVNKGRVVKNAGGAGMILINPRYYANTTSADAHVLPASDVSFENGLKIIDYINSTSTPTGTFLFKGTIIGDDRAPVVAAFSSRGPSLGSLGILKPDIIGPGVNILAAWHVSVDNNENTKSTFNMISGTSMSCPHLSGVAALLKSAHPDWSPAAIKSALMTTADVVNLAKNPIEDQKFLPADIFATGAGHVNPSRSNDPGLIYDIKPEDYIPYLCGLNYTDRQMQILLQRKYNCAVESSIPEAQLNYPSFSVILGSTTQTYSRTVTNVGEAMSRYAVEIVAPPGVNINIEPETLEFTEVNQNMTYKATFSQSGTNTNANFAQGFLVWTSTKYSVRSPIAVIFS